jgi:uncharacterized protein with von Willebrand factor type A (vWA) domain
MTALHLPFWSFFHDLEKVLSYERWIDKYKLFLDALTSNKIGYDADYAQFIQFCKILYLQDHRDEDLFVQLLLKAIAREKEWLQVHLRKAAEQELVQQEPDRIEEEATPKETSPKSSGEETKSGPARPQQPKEDKETTEEETPASGNSSKVFYTPSFFDLATKDTPEKAASQTVSYLYNDEYYPVSRRQMVKGWQFLRRQEKGGWGKELDLAATIRQIAKDGLFLEAKYKQGIRNREDAIVIFADYRGSMVAFHELTDRLIATARSEGGHPMAPVFYFQNYPAGFVYKKSNLTEPVKIRQALAKANKNFTIAIVISDAGSARVSRDEHISADRLQKTEFLLKHLRETCAHTIWFNPMPRHRWPGTAAALISKKVFLMAPLFEQESFKFQDILRTILKQGHHIENKKQ